MDKKLSKKKFTIPSQQQFDRRRLPYQSFQNLTNCCEAWEWVSFAGLPLPRLDVMILGQTLLDASLQYWEEGYEEKADNQMLKPDIKIGNYHGNFPTVLIRSRRLSQALYNKGVPIWTSLPVAWIEEGKLNFGPTSQNEESNTMILQRFPGSIYCLPPFPLRAVTVGFAVIEAPFQLDLLDIAVTLGTGIKAGECYPSIFHPTRPPGFGLFIEPMMSDFHQSSKSVGSGVNALAGFLQFFIVRITRYCICDTKRPSLQPNPNPNTLTLVNNHLHETAHSKGTFEFEKSRDIVAYRGLALLVSKLQMTTRPYLLSFGDNVKDRGMLKHRLQRLVGRPSLLHSHRNGNIELIFHNLPHEAVNDATAVIHSQHNLGVEIFNVRQMIWNLSGKLRTIHTAIADILELDHTKLDYNRNFMAFVQRKFEQKYEYMKHRYVWGGDRNGHRAKNIEIVSRVGKLTCQSKPISFEPVKDYMQDSPTHPWHSPNLHHTSKEEKESFESGEHKHSPPRKKQRKDRR